MTATADIRYQTSDIRPAGLKRAPFVIAGLVLAGIFMWQSCQLLVREPPHPKATPTEEDYPLEAGLVWVYKAPGGWQVIRKLGPEVEQAGHRWFEMRFSLPIGEERLLMRRTPEGIVGRRADREQLIMKFPMKPGDTWTLDFPDRPLAECTVLEPEEINVLSKKTLASKVRVVKTDRKTGMKTDNFEWYARGIGLVQMEVTYGFTARFILERFEKAK
jgi:hypothetical protein